MLTERQAEVAALVARGLSDRRIAAELGISPATARQHVRDAAERLPGAGPPRYRLTLYALARARQAAQETRDVRI